MLGIESISTVYRLGVGEFDVSKSVKLFPECVMSEAISDADIVIS